MSVDYSWELPADSTAAGQARWHVRQFLSDHTEAVDVELVVSELVTNAWKHGHGQAPITLTAELREDCLHLRVCGDSDDVPRADTPGDTEGGRGLLLISELTRAWGFERDGERLCVWAEVATTTY